ncbi:MAG TPA: NAD(P)-dependent oxidoreductase [Gammaproteobacteria bacterium]|nr:NAD(P)-dependent oxidoreductase [Gammaproteobacteria bacterium]
MKTAFIGLGAMGAPMAHNLHKAGFLTKIHNRTAERAETFAADTGCAVAASVAEAGRGCDAVVLCVSADADVLAVVDALAPALARDAVVIDCSTVKAGTAQAAAARLAEVGAHFLDAPVSGGTEGAKAGTLAMMVGGEADIFDRARPLLAAMAKRIVHMGPAGAGQATKAVNQIMVAGINQAVTEALAFGEAMDLPMDKVIDVVGGGAAGNWFLDHRGPTMVKGKFPLGFKVALHQKDLEICQAMAARHDTQLPIVEMTLLHYARLLRQGHGDDDISALFRLKKALFGGKSQE